MRQFDIIGAGMGTRETLTGEAAQALASAEMVFATERLADICENALNNQLRFSVGICSGKRKILTDRHAFGLTVYGCRRTEYNQLDIVL